MTVSCYLLLKKALKVSIGKLASSWWDHSTHLGCVVVVLECLGDDGQLVIGNGEAALVNSVLNHQPDALNSVGLTLAVAAPNSLQHSTQYTQQKQILARHCESV